VAEDAKAEVKETSSELSSRAAALQGLLRLLIKAQKGLRLYEANNAIAHRLENDLYAKLFAHLEEEGSFELTVQEYRILFGEDEIYEGHDRNDSLAFTLFRDGIRRLSFHPGLEGQELHGFLSCLNRAGVHSQEQDDLVTLLWEQDFKSIKYYAIEDLKDESTGPSLQEQLQSGTAGEGSGGATPDSVSLKDLEQPNAHLPNDACRLGEEEIEALRAELANQENEPYGPLVVELGIELTLQERRREERERLVEGMVAIIDRLLKDGQLLEVARLCEHLEGLADMLLAKSEAVGHLREKVFRALGETDRVSSILEQVEQSRALKPSELTTFLARLGSGALRSVIPAMGRMSTSPYRRAVADAILAAKEGAVAELKRHIPSNGDLPDAAFLRELVYILSHLPEDQALPLTEQLLQAPDETIRREATAVLGRFRSVRSGEICLRLLQDDDLEVRGTALDTLVRSGVSEFAKAVFDQAIADATFEDRSYLEQSRTFSAVAKLGGTDSLPWFTELVRPDERRWFASRKERQIIQAAVHGIYVVGTQESKNLLEQMAKKGDRFVRAASQKQLSAERKN
jgi:HEAT repeat protein